MKIYGVIGAACIMFGFFLLLVFGGMLDTPGSAIFPAACVGIIAVAVFGVGGWFANMYERSRK